MTKKQAANKSILDSREEIKKIDKSGALASAEALADQVRHAWKDVQKLEFTPQSEIKNVVIAGMGGSGLGGHVIKYLFKEQLTVPFEKVNSYTLPGHIDQHTLVVLSSYSGDTEEILSCAQQAEKAGAQIMVITAGGKLKTLAEEKNYTRFIINPVHNPSQQPRMAIGYSVFGIIGLLSKAGIFKLEEHEVEETITTIIKTIEQCQIEVGQESNLAKLIAYTCIERRAILVAGEFLTGAIHVSANQFNENAKAFADYKLIPEINHHLMEGLKFPKNNDSGHVFLFINSNLYLDRNQKRMALTQQVVEQNDIETLKIDLQSETKLTQVFELLTLFGFANLYLGFLEGIDPCPIPFVDWFKAELNK